MSIDLSAFPPIPFAADGAIVQRNRCLLQRESPVPCQSQRLSLIILQKRSSFLLVMVFFLFSPCYGFLSSILLSHFNHERARMLTRGLCLAQWHYCSHSIVLAPIGGRSTRQILVVRLFENVKET